MLQHLATNEKLIKDNKKINFWNFDEKKRINLILVKYMLELPQLYQLILIN